MLRLAPMEVKAAYGAETQNREQLGAADSFPLSQSAAGTVPEATAGVLLAQMDLSHGQGFVRTRRGHPTLVVMWVHQGDKRVPVARSAIAGSSSHATP